MNLQLMMTIVHFRYTSHKSNTNGTNVYGIILSWPQDSTLTLGAPVTTSQTTVTMLGYDGTFKWQAHPGGGIVLTIPPIPANKMPCKWAWTFKINNLKN